MSIFPPQPTRASLHRREVLAALSAAVPLAMAPNVAWAATALKGDELPLETTGLEHIGLLVPDVTKAAEFYGRLFNPAVHKEKDPPLRYYVLVGKSYMAFGSRATAPNPAIDHYCVLLKKYDRARMDARLAEKGLSPAKYGIVPNADGVGLQLLEAPAGLAATTVPAGNIVPGTSLVKALKMESILLRVTDLDKSAAFLSMFFPMVASQVPGQRWFAAADTMIAIRPTVGREQPAVDDWVVRCQHFDRARVSAALAALGAVILPSPTDHLRFLDPNGLPLTLRMNAA